MPIADSQVIDDRSVTASFGVATFPDHAADAARLVRSADRALYQAKAKGRNRVEMFSVGTHPAEREDEPAGNGRSAAAEQSRV